MGRALNPSENETWAGWDGEVPVTLDLLRGELYRLLDELARAGPEAQGPLLEQLQDTLERFRGELAMRR